MIQRADRRLEEPIELDERRALERCQRGDAQAFDLLVRKYMKRAYFTALALVGNHEDALDLSQDAFIRAYRALPRFRIKQRFFTWFYRILRNCCLNHLRQQSRCRSVSIAATGSGSVGSESTAVVLSDEADPAVLAQRNDVLAQVWRAIGHLNPDEREILVLREIEDCAYAEISQRLEIPVGTVMSRLFYARKHLRELVNGLL